jgi:hypothetical protein
VGNMILVNMGISSAPWWAKSPSKCRRFFPPPAVDAGINK